MRPRRKLLAWMPLGLTTFLLVSLIATITRRPSEPTAPDPRAHRDVAREVPRAVDFDSHGDPVRVVSGSPTAVATDAGSAERPERLAATAAVRTTSSSRHPATPSEPDDRPRRRFDPGLQRALARALDENPALVREAQERSSRTRLRFFEAAGLLRASGPPRRVSGAAHRSLALTKQGFPVFNRPVRRHERGSDWIGMNGRLGAPPFDPAGWDLSRHDAIVHARRHLSLSGGGASATTRKGWFAGPRRSVPAWQVSIPATESHAAWRVTVDAQSGRAVKVESLVLFESGSGWGYSNDPVTSPAPEHLPLVALDGEGQLSGTYTKVFDARSVEAYRPDLVFDFPEHDPRFVQTAVYRNLTDMAIFAVERGFPDFPEPVLALTNLEDSRTGGEFNNAFYSPLFPYFGFGNGDGARTANLGIDRDVAAHEMGHHLFQALVDPDLEGNFSSMRALHEGIADTFAALLSHDPEIGESTIPGQNFLRELGATRSYRDEDPNGEYRSPHIEGLIFASYNWKLQTILGRDEFTEVLIASLPFVPLDFEFPHLYRDALLEGDSLVTGGANAFWINRYAVDHGLDIFEGKVFKDVPDLELYWGGLLEVGEPLTGTIPNDTSLLFVFDEFDGSKQLTFELSDEGSRQSDLDIWVYPASGRFMTWAEAGGPGSNHTLVIDETGNPDVHDDDLWFVEVFDANLGNHDDNDYRLSVEIVLPDPAIAYGETKSRSLDEIGDVDWTPFEARAGDVVRVEVIADEDELDLIAVVWDPIALAVYGGDDDSGPGLNPLIQGASIPEDGTYSVAVFSLTSDVDPKSTTGPYSLTIALCPNDGADLDGDGLADECDDDDDDDGFEDAADSDPRDAERCFDVDGDDCDDCISGDFDPFDDGADFDGDGICDGGDLDDDNDGCEDEHDPRPQSPSLDDDQDFIGDDCDNCPAHHNVDQLDGDGDGIGDACDEVVPEPEPSSLALAALLTLIALRWAGRRRSAHHAARRTARAR